MISLCFLFISLPLSLYRCFSVAIRNSHYKRCDSFVPTFHEYWVWFSLFIFYQIYLCTMCMLVAQRQHRRLSQRSGWKSYTWDYFVLCQSDLNINLFGCVTRTPVHMTRIDGMMISHPFRTVIPTNRRINVFYTYNTWHLFRSVHHIQNSYKRGRMQQFTLTVHICISCYSWISMDDE